MDNSVSVMDDSCLMMDLVKSSRRELRVCEVCKLGEDMLLNRAPLIPLVYENPGYALCRSCLKQHIAQNTSIEQKNYHMRFKVKNLHVPGTQQEFPRCFLADGKTNELINIPKINTTNYMILERTNYDRPLGTVEGIVIKFNEKRAILIGKDPNQADIVINHPSISDIHCTVTFEADLSFRVQDHNNLTKTFIRPYNNPVVDESSPSVQLKIYDHVVGLTWKNSVAITPPEHVMMDSRFHTPTQTLVPENLIPYEGSVFTIKSNTGLAKTMIYSSNSPNNESPDNKTFTTYPDNYYGMESIGQEHPEEKAIKVPIFRSNLDKVQRQPLHGEPGLLERGQTHHAFASLQSN